MLWPEQPERPLEVGPEERHRGREIAPIEIVEEVVGLVGELEATRSHPDVHCGRGEQQRRRCTADMRQEIRPITDVQASQIWYVRSRLSTEQPTDAYSAQAAALAS